LQKVVDRADVTHPCDDGATVRDEEEAPMDGTLTDEEPPMASSIVCASCGAKINPVTDPSICPVCGSGDRQITVHDYAKIDSHETTVSVLSTMHLWIAWTEIALEQTQAASEARSRGLPYRSTDQSHLFAAALHDEMKASMVAIAAAACAIDAFLKKAVQKRIQVPDTTAEEWTTDGIGRMARFWKTLQLGFDVGEDKVQRWQTEFDWLYPTRNKAVHFEEVQSGLLPHPSGTNTAPELVTYSLEEAERAVDLLIDVLKTCIQNPKPEQRQLVAYVTRFEVELARLSEKRAQAVEFLSDGSQS